MSDKYIIQSQHGSGEYCLGVLQASSGQHVILSMLQGAGSLLTQWFMDPTSGHIRLAANDQLYLDVQGTVTEGSRLILNTYTTGRVSQAWNWVGNRPFIYNNAASGMLIDNQGGKTSQGNPIQLWKENKTPAQKWTLVSVTALSQSAS